MQVSTLFNALDAAVPCQPWGCEAVAEQELRELQELLLSDASPQD